MEIAILMLLAAAVILIPFTLIPHLYSLLRWKDYPYFPGIRLQSAIWGACMLVLTGWGFLTRYDVVYNDHRWFGELRERGWLDVSIAALIFAAVLTNTIVYWRVVHPREPHKEQP